MKKTEIRQLALGILIEGRHRFGAMLGIVSQIHNGTYGIFAASSATGIPEAGDRYPLTAVYCREVVECGRTVAITEINGVQGMRLHPLYDAIPCEFYISSPILVRDEVWGTLNFTSFAKRDSPFSAEDIAYNEANAMKVATALAE